MKEIIDEAVSFLVDQDIRGCLTGSCLLGYWEGQDIDIFCYDEQAFTKTLFMLKHNKMFQLIEPIEEWKFNQWVEKGNSSFKKLDLVTVKLKYNLSVDVNIIYKKNQTNIFSVLSNFDMDIISVGIDLQTKQYLDLSQSEESKIEEAKIAGLTIIPNTKYATWNKWNTSYYSPDIWTIRRLLNQFLRTIKYHSRSYVTDLVVLKYIELTDDLLNYTNIFNSLSFEDKLESIQINAAVLKQLFIKWLETHELNKEELDLLQQKIKEL